MRKVIMAALMVAVTSTAAIAKPSDKDIDTTIHVLSQIVNSCGSTGWAVFVGHVTCGVNAKDQLVKHGTAIKNVVGKKNYKKMRDAAKGSIFVGFFGSYSLTGIAHHILIDLKHKYR